MSSHHGDESCDPAPATDNGNGSKDAMVINVAVPLEHFSAFASRLNRSNDGEQWRSLAVPPGVSVPSLLSPLLQSSPPKEVRADESRVESWVESSQSAASDTPPETESSLPAPLNSTDVPSDESNRQVVDTTNTDCPCGGSDEEAPSNTPPVAGPLNDITVYQTRPSIVRKALGYLKQTAYFKRIPKHNRISFERGLREFALWEMMSFTLSQVCGPHGGGTLGDKVMSRLHTGLDKWDKAWDKASYDAAAIAAGAFVLYIVTSPTTGFSTDDVKDTVQDWIKHHVGPTAESAATEDALLEVQAQSQFC